MNEAITQKETNKKNIHGKTQKQFFCWCAIILLTLFRSLFIEMIIKPSGIVILKCLQYEIYFMRRKGTKNIDKLIIFYTLGGLFL